MINGRRDEAISHSYDGVRVEYIKHFRHNHVADCLPRSVCNDSERLGHGQALFLPRGPVYAQSRAVIDQLYVQVRARAWVVAFQWAAISRHRVPGAGGVRHGARELGTPGAGGLEKPPNTYLKRRCIPVIRWRS